MVMAFAGRTAMASLWISLLCSREGARGRRGFGAGKNAPGNYCIRECTRLMRKMPAVLGRGIALGKYWPGPPRRSDYFTSVPVS